MSLVRTAISIERSLLQDADKLAKELEVPRSRVFARAMAEYLRRHRGRDALTKLNKIHAADPAREDREFIEAATASFAKLTEGQW